MHRVDLPLEHFHILDRLSLPVKQVVLSREGGGFADLERFDLVLQYSNLLNTVSVVINSPESSLTHLDKIFERLVVDPHIPRRVK